VTIERSVDRVQFISSSFCTMGGCVEVGQLADGGVAVRDSKNPGRSVLIFSGDEWAEFVSGVRAGEFDRFGTDACRPKG
jgi:hypothetical protein